MDDSEHGQATLIERIGVDDLMQLAASRWALIGSCIVAQAVSCVMFFILTPHSEIFERWRGPFLSIQLALSVLTLWPIMMRRSDDCPGCIIIFLVRFALVALLGFPLAQRTFLQLPLVLFTGLEIATTIPPTRAAALGAILLVSVGAVQGPVDAWHVEVPGSTPAELFLYWSVSVTAFAASLAFRRQHDMKAATFRNLYLAARGAKELARVNIDLQRHSAEVEREAMIAERKRLTGELHDTVGYVLMNQITLMEVAIRVSEGIAPQQPDPNRLNLYNELVEVLHQSRRQAKDGLDDVRRSLYALRARFESRRTRCVEQIHSLVSAFANTPIVVHLELSNIGTSGFSEEVDYLLYRTAQEGITNALRHGNATRVDIVLWRNQDTVGIVVRDNGMGSADVKPGIGLFGIAERVERLRGEVHTGSSADGFVLRVRVPWVK